MISTSYRLLPWLLSSLAPLHAESLWSTKGGEPRSLYADHKATGVGDIITVVVAESAAAQSTQNKQSTRTSSLNDAVTQFVFPAALTHNGVSPSLQVSGNSNYTGGGQVTNSNSVTSRAAVLVTDVLPNGNFVIEGVRTVVFSGETQYIVLHGLVRPDDVGSDDTVNSTSIAEARVEMIDKGALNDAEKQGWFSKLYEMLRPI